MARYKIGDKLKCLPGFIIRSNTDAGAGYVENKVFIVAKITPSQNNDSCIYWPLNQGADLQSVTNGDDNTYEQLGIYGRAVTLADEVVNTYQIY